MTHQHPTERAQSPSHGPGHPSGPLASPGELNEPHADAQPPADLAALRDRIAQAIDGAFRTFDPDHTEDAQLSGHLTDAVLVVLPEPTDRGAVLTETERRMLTYALDQAQEKIWSEDSFTDEDQAAVDALRRMAAIGRPAERPRCPHGCDTSRCPCLACEATAQPETVPDQAAEAQPETWRTDPRERLLTAIDRTWARGVLGTTPEQLLDAYAHQLAEQLRAESGSYGSPGYDYELGPGLGRAADLIDPEAQR